MAMCDISGAVAAVVRDHLKSELWESWQELGAELWASRLAASELWRRPPADGARRLEADSPLVQRQYLTALRRRKAGLRERCRAPSFAKWYAEAWKVFLKKPDVHSGRWWSMPLHDATLIVSEAVDVAFEHCAARLRRASAGEGDSGVTVRTTETFARAALPPKQEEEVVEEEEVVAKEESSGGSERPWLDPDDSASSMGGGLSEVQAADVVSRALEDTAAAFQKKEEEDKEGGGEVCLLSLS